MGSGALNWSRNHINTDQWSVAVQRKGAGDMHGQVIGALRLGDKAAIGNGFWMSAHGGAVSWCLTFT